MVMVLIGSQKAVPLLSYAPLHVRLQDRLPPPRRPQVAGRSKASLLHRAGHGRGRPGGIDQDQWGTRIIEILRDEEPDYRARLQLEGRWEPSPWPDRPALRWTIYLPGGREGLRLELYDTFSQESADHFAQSVIDMLKEGFISELQIPPMRNELTD